MSSKKHILLFSLFFIIGFQILHKAGFIIYFALNKADIVETHCVNKAIKPLKCDGKCHLKKYVSLEDTEEQRQKEQKPFFPKIEKENFWVFIIPQAQNYLKNRAAWPDRSSCSSPDDYLISLTKAVLLDIFHPPCIIQIV
jgi:hypothetical protein